ncbi:MAG: T9SS type A sorting domain-containing protein [Bacteroidetes bacterium]|nr:T9SS type A sorting domain-containing protein [Bacteroidota bacterium]
MVTTLNCAKILASFTFVFMVCSATAQPEHFNWVLDGDILIDFSTGVPDVKEEPLEFSTIEAAASISDSLGNLLFYTNGVEVYNRLGEVISEMEIPIGDTSFYKSYSQGVLILPEYGQENKYRIVGIGRYAIVDMSMNGGLGGMANVPNWQPFDSDVPGWSERNVAVRHGNGRDWWIIQMRASFNLATESWDSSFVLYLNNNNGVYVEEIFQLDLRAATSASTFRQMAISPTGSSIAIVFPTSISIYQFDRCGGLIGSEIIYVDSLSNLHSCEFSPSGRYLYFNSSSAFYIGDNILYQLDLEADQFGKFALNKIYIRSNYGTFANGQLQMGPDHKIYMTVGCKILNCDIFSALNMNLSVINYPDLPGLSCDFDTLGLYLGGRRTMLALPNTVNYALGPLEGSECDTLDGGSTAIPEASTLPQWQITPTVSAGWYSFNGPDHAILIVYDVWGRTVWQGSATGQRIDLSTLPTGLYLVHAQWEQKQATFRIVKQ